MLRTCTLPILLLAAVAAPVSAEVVETRELSETVVVGSPIALEVVVDNVFGSIRVTAHDRDTVEMVATETIRADTQSDLERARAEVGLQTERENGRVAFLVRRGDGECPCDCACRWHHWDGYIVAYDIELRVPGESSLVLETVNNGEIAVDDVHGDFSVANVNGPVTLRGLRGAGRASTVNGKLLVEFERAPAEDVAFETVNGEIEVGYPADLSADLRFKTMRGDIWTDFEVTPLALSPVREQSQDGGHAVFRAEQRSGVRVRSGGPAHSFETLNGDIYIRDLGR